MEGEGGGGDVNNDEKIQSQKGHEQLAKEEGEESGSVPTASMKNAMAKVTGLTTFGHLPPIEESSVLDFDSWTLRCQDGCPEGELVPYTLLEEHWKIRHGGSLADVKNWILECTKCPGKMIAYARLDKHKSWHGRVNLLAKLKAIIEDSGMNPFGPGQSGCFVMLDYKKPGMGYEGQQKGVTEEDARNFLRQRWPGPFVNLNYAEGRKYTFGNTFVSRAKQGDFVYLNLNPSDKDIPKVEAYFHLECKESEGLIDEGDNGQDHVLEGEEESVSSSSGQGYGIWIGSDSIVEGFGSAFIVSVNGQALGSGRIRDAHGQIANNENECSESPLQQQLVFGDIVTISIRENEAVKSFCDLLFKATIDHGSAAVNNMRVAEGVLGIPLIVENILNFLPTHEVEQFRLLSPTWNAEALKILPTRVILQLIDLSCGDYTDAVLQISDYAHSQLNEVKFPHWAITFSENQNDCSAARGHRKMMRDRKILGDLAWFLNPDHYTHNGKCLRLAGRVDSETRMAMLEEIFRGVKGTLTTLDLELAFTRGCKSLLPPSFDEMPNLTTLSFSRSEEVEFARNLSERPEFFEPFVKGFVPAVTNLQALRMGLIPFECQASTTFLREIANIQLQNPEKFANLTSITLGSGGDVNFHSLGLLREGSLKKLVLGDISPMDPGLRAVLENQAVSLEELTLQFSTNLAVSSRTTTIPFPQRMPNLKALAVLCFFEEMTGMLEDIPQLEVPATRFGFTFGRREDAIGLGPAAGATVNSINYRSHFPCLSKLLVWPTFYRRFEGSGPEKTSRHAVWGSFLPILSAFIEAVTDEDGHVIQNHSIKNLDIPFTLSGKYHHVLDNVETAFPNADFPPALAIARNGPVWNLDEERRALNLEMQRRQRREAERLINIQRREAERENNIHHGPEEEDVDEDESEEEEASRDGSENSDEEEENIIFFI